MKPATFLRAWDGLGDSIYLRPFVRALSIRTELYLATPWPELFEDLRVHFVRPDSPYRTQRKNELNQPHDQWEAVPPGARRIRPYLLADGRSIPQGISDRIPLKDHPFIFDLPDFGPMPEAVALAALGRRVAVIRPATVRSEWASWSRNPDPEYLWAAGCELRDQGYFVVSVADLKKGEEWIAGPAPVCDLAFHSGELDTRKLVSLVRHASIAVGGVGFILPMAIATRTPLIVLAGGRGHYENPDRLIGMGMDDSRVRWIMPDNYCRCDKMDHDCDKTISDFERKFAEALEDLR